MVKSKLIQNLADLYPTMLRKDIIKIVNIIFLEIINSIKKNEPVEIRNFGRFSSFVDRIFMDVDDCSMIVDQILMIVE